MRKRLDGGVYTLIDGSSSAASSCCIALRLPGTHGNDSSPTSTSTHGTHGTHGTHVVSQGASPLDLVASFAADVRRIYENGTMYVIHQRQNVQVLTIVETYTCIYVHLHHHTITLTTMVVLSTVGTPPRLILSMVSRRIC